MPSVDPYATQVVSRLWPTGSGAATTRRPVGLAATEASWWVLPSASRARLLVPAGRSGAATMLVRHGDGARRVARLVTGAAVRSGLARLLPLARVTARAGGPLQQVLEDVLGEGLTCGLLLGPPRVNRKPVLQVFDRAGATVAFVKVGTDAATSALVARETRCLAQVHRTGLRLVQAPGVLHAGRVGDLEVLVLEPLVSSQQAGRTAFPPPPVEAMAELADSHDATREPLSRTVFWTSVRDAVGGVQHEPTRQRLEDLVRRIEAACGDAEVVTGSWHGDWAPWNTGRAAGRVQLWDWERFDPDALWGLDLLHYLAQRVRHAAPDRVAQESDLLAAWPRELAGSPGAGAEQDPRAVLLAYLPALAVRLAGPGAGEHPRARWACELAARVLDDPGTLRAGAPR